ncbi:hypothetical protein O3M35_009477 [Rhynocoris fuscipes]|uniref:Uncharacterized protein n=1 Tax=Rhynocoris fuscipes TaxID=488301 RepID=A0AAW1D4H5_9HEMI
MLSKYIIVTALLGFFAVTVSAEDVVDTCGDFCRMVSRYMCREDKFMNVCSGDNRDLMHQYCTVECLKSIQYDWKYDFETEKRVGNAKVDSLLYILRLVNYPFHNTRASYFIVSRPDDEETVVNIADRRNPAYGGSRKRRMKREFNSKSYNTGGALGGSVGAAIGFGSGGFDKEAMASAFVSGYGNKKNVAIKDDGTRYDDYIGASAAAGAAGKIHGDSMNPNYDLDYTHGANGKINVLTTAEKYGKRLYGAEAAARGGYLTKGTGVLVPHSNTGYPMLSTISNTYGIAEAAGASQIGNDMKSYFSGKGKTLGLSRYNIGLGYGSSGFALQSQGIDKFNTLGELEVYGGTGQSYPTIPRYHIIDY